MSTADVSVEADTSSRVGSGKRPAASDATGAAITTGTAEDRPSGDEKKRRRRSTVKRTAPPLVERIGRAIDLGCYGALIVLLAWAPLPLGSNRPWAWSLLALLSATLALVYALRRLLLPASDDSVRWRWPVALAAPLLLVVPVWGWIQTLPADLLDAGWVSAIVGDEVAGAWHDLIARHAHPLWATAREAGLEVTPILAMERAAALTSVMRFLGYLAVGWLAFELLRDRARARLFVDIVLGIMMVYAVWGLIRRGFGIDMIFWHVEGTASVVTSTFPNRNHFATMMNMGVMLALTCLVPAFLHRTRISWKRMIVEGAEEILERQGRYVAVAMLLLVTSLLTASRGGFLSLVLGVLALAGFVLVKRRPGFKVVAGSAVAVVAILGLMVALFGEQVLDRLDNRPNIVNETSTDETATGRVAVWLKTIDLIERRPWLGHGYGSYELAFESVREPRFGAIFDYAHNTYLEVASDVGVPAAAALYAGGTLLFATCLVGAFRRREDMALPLVGVGVTVVTAAHAITDFSLQIPAIATLYAALMGLACAQAYSRAGRRRRRPRRLEASAPAGP